MSMLNQGLKTRLCNALKERKERALEDKARLIARSRIEEAVKTFPSQKPFVAAKVRRANHVRKMMRRLMDKPLYTPTELAEIRQRACLNYPKTKQDKISYIRADAEYSVSTHEIVKELEA